MSKVMKVGDYTFERQADGGVLMANEAKAFRVRLPMELHCEFVARMCVPSESQDKRRLVRALHQGRLDPSDIRGYLSRGDKDGLFALMREAIEKG